LSTAGEKPHKGSSGTFHVTVGGLVGVLEYRVPQVLERKYPFFQDLENLTAP